MKRIINTFFENEKTRVDRIIYSLTFLSFFLMCVSILLFSNNKLHILYYVFFVLFFIGTLIRTIRKKEFFLTIQDVFVVLFIFCVIISSLSNRPIRISTTPFSVAAIFIVCSHFITKKNYTYVLWALNISFIVFLAVFIGYYKSQIISFNFSNRIGTFFQNENTVGYYFVYGLCLSLWFALKKKWNFFWLIVSAIDVLMILYTGSRSALLISIGMLFIFVFLLFGRKKIWLSLIISIGIIGLFIIFISIPYLSPFKDRIEKIINSQDSSASERYMLLREGFDLFFAKPLFGWGYNGMTNMSTGHLFAHNNLVQLLSDFGVFAFILFESLLIYPFYKTFQKQNCDKRQEFRFVWLFLVSIFLVQFFYANYQLKFEYIFLSLSWTMNVDCKIFKKDIKVLNSNPVIECNI